MDSPLLPTIQRPEYSYSFDGDEPSSLIADLSLDSEPPLSPSDAHPKARGARFADHDDADDTHEHGYGGRSTSGVREVDPVSHQASTAGTRGGGGRSKPRFSLFAAPRPPSAGDDHLDPADREDDDQDHTIHARAQSSSEREGDRGADTINNANANPNAENEVEKQRPKPSSAERDAKLRESLYELRQMNEVFDGFLGALEGVRGHNDRLAERVQQTSRLLDEYTAIMGQAEHTQQLLLNPRWTGSVDDAAALAAEEEARHQAEATRQAEVARAAEQARIFEEERERRMAEAARTKELSGAGRGGVRGRGAGAGAGSGTRGRGAAVTRGRVPSGGTGIPRPSIAPSRPNSTGSGSARKVTPSSTGATNGTASAAGGGGLGGQYSHVKSSGYGPPRRS